MVLLAVGIAVLAGAAVGGLSQMTAVSRTDPRPSNPPDTPSPLVIATATPSPSTSATAVPSPTPEAGGEVWLYILASGDSLSGLAIRYGTTTEELLTLNPEYADNQDLVQVGSQMIMPCTPIATAEDRC